MRNLKVQISSLVITLAVGTIAFCGNTYHQREASRVLSMQECLKCHNGTVGKHVHVCVGAECLLKGTHSVLSTYPPSRRTNDYATRADIESAGCILENGTITCLSCHDLTKPAPHLIRTGDDLCRICHLGQ